MKKSYKLYGLTALLIMFTVISIGYASVANILTVEGTATTTPPPFEGVYICGAEELSSNGVVDNICDYVQPPTLKQTSTFCAPIRILLMR